MFKLYVSLIGILLFFSLFSVLGDAVWQNTSYVACRNLTITNAKANYTAFVNLTFLTAQSNYNDVLFVNDTCNNGGVSLPYFARSNVSSIWATFDVRLNSVNNISVYYYNTTIGTQSDANTTWGGSLEHYWGFDEGQGTQTRDFLNDRNSGYNGTLINSTAASWNTTFRKGTSLNFNGVNTSVNISKDSDFPTGASARTLEAWVTQHFPEGTSTNYWFRYGVWDNSQAWTACIMPTNNLFCLVTHTSNTQGNNVMKQYITYLLNFVYNGTHVLIYENGTLDIAQSQTLNTQLNGYVIIGAGDIEPTKRWNGTIDEVKIYTNALNSTEISNHYSSVEPTFSVGGEETFGVNPTSIRLFLNGTEGDISMVYGSALNSTALINITGLWVTIEKNGTLITNGTTNSTNITVWESGYFRIRGYFAGNVTYGSSEQSYFVNITPQPTNINLSINGTQGDVTGNYPYPTNVTGWKTISGGNFSLFRNGVIINSTITNDIVSETKKFGVGTYNYTLNFILNNYTSSPVTRILTISQGDSGLNLTSSEGFILSPGQTTIIDCNVPSYVGLSTTTMINGAIVTTPFTLQVQVGTYTTTCSIPDGINYTNPSTQKDIIVSSALTCTSSNTFAFRKSFTPTFNTTTFNFTDIVNQGLVRKSLGDLNITNGSLSINTTNGYYVIVNNTSSTFDLRFSNYYVNTTFGISGITNLINLTPYNQISPYVQYNILDEFNGSALYPPGTNVTTVIDCNRGQNFIEIENTTSLSIALLAYVTKTSLRVSYSPDLFYSRQFYPNPKDVLIINFYIVDAFKNALSRIDFLMQDPTYYNQKVIIYKPLNASNTTLTITEGFFDTSHIFSAYLAEDIDYYIRTISSNGVITEFGRITVVSPGIKELGQSTFNLNPSAIYISQNILMNAYMDSNRTTLTVTYQDKLNKTDSVNYVIFFQDGSVWQNQTYFNTANFIVSHTIPNYNRNDTFTVLFTVSHQQLGNSPVQYQMTVAGAVGGFTFGIDSLWLNLFSLFALVTVSGLATRESLFIGVITTMVVFLILIGIGWLGANMWAVFAMMLITGTIILIDYVQKSEGRAF